MTNKTPFELRFDLLNLAQGILTDKMFAQRQRLENDWNARRDILMAKAATLDEASSVALKDYDPFPEMPSVDPDEIIELAKKLNEFVSNSGDNKNA